MDKFVYKNRSDIELLHRISLYIFFQFTVLPHTSLEIRFTQGANFIFQFVIEDNLRSVRRK
jgi:hypothetical protein